jgi:hypothetical protein
MHLLNYLLFLLAGIKWGDWKNWRIYYPTILFLICGDLLKNALLRNYRMWEFHEVIFGEKILIGHLTINLMIMIFVYPATILIFLGHYPKGWWKQVLWVAFWVLLYFGKEFVNFKFFHEISHHHGWNLGWSFIFDIIMFIILRIHFKKPLLAWAISVPWIIFLLVWFHVPIDAFK